MKKDIEALVATFIKLGRELSDFGKDAHTREIISRAVQANSWFSEDDIVMAVSSIRNNMLTEDALQQWLLPYPAVPIPKNVGVIMAGNIPLVGFFDLLCVVISGHKCYIKPSSKDAILMEYIVSLLRNIDPNIAIYTYANQPLDAVIATGSNNTNRYFRSRYGSIPAIFRGNRSSVAIVMGNESRDELARLASDIFSFSGLGCRNVSHLLVPEGYDFEPLITELSNYERINPKYINNFRQRVATLKMNGVPFFQGAHFVLRQSQNSAKAISEITYDKYINMSDIREFLSTNDHALQCVVSANRDNDIEHPRVVKFGQTHNPSLTDYPDTVDTMEFLASI